MSGETAHGKTIPVGVVGAGTRKRPLLPPPSAPRSRKGGKAEAAAAAQDEGAAVFPRAKKRRGGKAAAGATGGAANGAAAAAAVTAAPAAAAKPASRRGAATKESTADAAARVAKEAKWDKKRRKIMKDAEAHAASKNKGASEEEVKAAADKEISKRLCKYAMDAVALDVWEERMARFEEGPAETEDVIRAAEEEARALATAEFEAFLRDSFSARESDKDKFLDKFEKKAKSTTRILVADSLQRKLTEKLAEVEKQQAAAEEAKKKAERQATDDPDAGLCTICIDKPKDAVLMPCGHRVCHECAPQMIRKPCYACRRKVTKFMRTYG